MTVFQLLFNIFVFSLLFLFLYPAYKKNHFVSNRRIYVSLILAVIFCVYNYWAGDYWHFLMAYDDMLLGYSSHFEDTYVELASYLQVSYHGFRFIIWGLTITLIFLTFKRINVNWGLSLFICLSFYLLWISYARVSLAMALMFYGNSYIVHPIKRQKLFSIFYGSALIALSYLFHRSAPFGIILILASYLLLWIKGRLKILFLFLLFPLIVFYTRVYLQNFMEIEMTEDALIDSATAQYYMASEASSHGWGSIIENSLVRIPFYLIAYLYFYYSYKNLLRKVPTDIRQYGLLAFLIVIISSVFAFDLGYNTYVVYYRFLNFAMIPLAVFFSYSLLDNHLRKFKRIIYCMGVIASFYTLFYSLYCLIVKM